MASNARWEPADERTGTEAQRETSHLGPIMAPFPCALGPADDTASPQMLYFARWGRCRGDDGGFRVGIWGAVDNGMGVGGGAERRGRP